MTQIEITPVNQGSGCACCAAPAPAAAKESAMSASENVATYTVTGMTCGHCAASVTEEVSAIGGVQSVEVDLATGAVTVASQAPLDLETVRAAVTEAGYQLTA
jgi:copper chaperone